MFMTCIYIYICYVQIYTYIHVHTYRFIQIYITLYIVHLNEYGQHLSFEAMVLLTWMRDYTALRMHSLATAPRNSRNPGEKGEDEIHENFHYVMIHESDDDDDDDEDVRWWLNHEIEASVGTWYGREELSSSDLKGSPFKHESLVEICSQKKPSGKRFGNICISFAFPGRVIVPSNRTKKSRLCGDAATNHLLVAQPTKAGYQYVKRSRAMLTGSSPVFKKFWYLGGFRFFCLKKSPGIQDGASGELGMYVLDEIVFLETVCDWSQMFGNLEILRYVAILQVTVPNFVQSMVDRMKYIDFDFVFVDEESLFDWAALHKIELNLLVATGRIENYASNPHCIVLGISYIISAQDVLPKGTELWAITFDWYQ